MSEYRFEKLSDTNLKDLIFLYRHAFNEKENLKFLKKKYNTSSFGLKNIGYIAYSSTNEPSAYYGIFPINAQINGKEILVAQSGDTMTHPNHRGKGLFITLAKMTYELAKKEDVEFVFGFPNDNSSPGFFKKLNWVHYANVNHYKIKTGALPLEKVAKKFKMFSGTYSSLVSSKLKDIDSPFPNSLSSQLKDHGNILHDKTFFDYKKYYRSSIIDINGVKCWVKVDGRFWVGDVEFCEQNKFIETVNGLISFSRKISCSTVQFSVFENSLYDQWLKEKYTLHSKNEVGCLNLSGNFKPEQFAYQAIDFDTF
jgi:hypothetical protein